MQFKDLVKKLLEADRHQIVWTNTALDPSYFYKVLEDNVIERSYKQAERLYRGNPVVAVQGRDFGFAPAGTDFRSKTSPQEVSSPEEAVRVWWDSWAIPRLRKLRHPTEETLASFHYIHKEFSKKYGLRFPRKLLDQIKEVFPWFL